MITFPDEIRDRRPVPMELRDRQAQHRMGALPSLIDKTTVYDSTGDARSVERNVWIALALLFIPVVGWMILVIWCQVLLREAARESHRPIVRMTQAPEGEDLIRRGEELHLLLSQRAPDADDVEWRNLVSQAETLHLEQQLLFARFRP